MSEHGERKGQPLAIEDKAPGESPTKPPLVAGPIRRHLIEIIVGCVLVLICALFLENLGTPHITMWDEVIHANVVKNLAEHCCLPRLHKSDLGTDYRHWTNNAVWLHKPLLPFYVTAAVYRTLGGSLWALRFPGAVFAVLTVVVVYLIGRNFLNKKIGLCGAAIFGLNPFTNSLVHGRTYSGFPDLAFAFFMSIALYLILEWEKSRSTTTLRWLGLVVGIGYLCKGGLALAPFAVLAEVAVLVGPARDLIAALQSIFVFSVVVLPERLYWLTHYPLEFRYEQHQQLLHLFTNIEDHGAPWHNYLTHRLPRILVPPMIPLAYFSIGWFVTRYGRSKTGFVLSLWTLTYVVPLSLGVSKISNFVFAILPAVALLVPAAMEELWEGGWHTTILGVCAASLGTLIWSRLYHDPRTIAALVAGTVLAVVFAALFLTNPGPRRLSVGAVMLTALALFFLYVGKDVYENSKEVTALDAGLSRSEQMQLRQAGSELRGLVDRNSLVIVSLGGKPKYLYLMYWSGVDVLDVCEEVPQFERFRDRKDLYAVSMVPLPATPVGSLSLGNLYPLKQVPFKTWISVALQACPHVLDTSFPAKDAQ